MRHFATKKEAVSFCKKATEGNLKSIHVFKKHKGMKNRIKKPFVVGTELEFLNQY